MVTTVRVRLLGVIIRITFPFSALVTLLLYIDRTGLMGYSLLAVVIHELGHLFIMSFVKAKPSEIELSLRGVLIVSPPIANVWQRLFIAIGGPAANILFGVLLWFCGFKSVGAVQWIVAAYNLLLIRGLDGGDILEALLCLLGVGDKKWIVSVCSYLTAGLIIIIGINLLLINGTNISLLLLGVYLLFLNLIKL